MNLKQSKLGIFNITTERFLCDFIFKFQFDERDQKSLLIRVLFATLNQKGTFAGKAFDHLYNSICFFTNGEKVVSYRKEDGVYELGIHHSINKFQHYFSENLYSRKIWDADISFKKFVHEETLEKEIYEILSVKEGKRRVMITGSEFNYMETFISQTNGIFLKLNTSKIIEFYTNDLLVISKRFEQKHTPIKLKSCINCGYFKENNEFSIGNTNSLHECMLIKQKTKPSEFNEAITHVWSYCSNFSKK